MKRLFSLLIAVVLTVSVFAQVPQKMSYQAVVRNSSNGLVINTQIGMEINIRQGSPSGSIVYTETQTPTTNANGLVSIEIGGGAGFNTIDWPAGPFFIETKTAVVAPLTTYTIIGTSQLLSVPYALHAKTAETVTSRITETDPVFTAWNKSTGISIAKSQISDLGTYLTTETDPVFTAWNKTTGISITSSQVSDFQTSVTSNAAVAANTAKNSYPTADATKLAGIAEGANVGVVPNAEITGSTKTKITYDAKGLVTAGENATTADIAASMNKNYVTDAQLTVIGNTSGTNTGDQDLSGKVDKVTGKDLAPNGTSAGQMLYWNGSAWINVAPGTTGQVLTFVSGVPTWKTQPLAGDVLNTVTGKIWMDRNLGATQVATSSTDAASYGDLYQWGRAADGHQLRTSNTTSSLSSSDSPGHGNFILAPSSPYDWRSPQNTNLWQGVSGINNPCPSEYRLPTSAEWEAERLSWSSNNAAGAFASPLKLPVAGGRSNSDGSLENVGSSGYYWSSTVSSADSRRLYFNISMASISSSRRASGFSVRCFKD